MAFKVYFPDDIKDRIVAQATTAIAFYRAGASTNYQHLVGFLLALQAQGLAVGLNWPSVVEEIRVNLALVPGHHNLIEGESR